MIVFIHSCQTSVSYWFSLNTRILREIIGIRLTFILARNVSMLETAVWKTSEGRSYQTLRQRRTCEDPSLMPGEIPPPAPGERRPRTSSPASRESSWWSSGWTSITTWRERRQLLAAQCPVLTPQSVSQPHGRWPNIFEGKINRLPPFKPSNMETFYFKHCLD